MTLQQRALVNLESRAMKTEEMSVVKKMDNLA
jgi:hypothetical protein